MGNRVAQLALAEAYRETASDLMIWIAVGYACLSVATCFDVVAYGTRRTRYLALATGVAAVTNVGLGLLFVPGAVRLERRGRPLLRLLPTCFASSCW